MPPLPIPIPDPLLLPMQPSHLKALTARNTEEDNILLIQGPRELDPAMNPYLDRMPPFAGTKQEAELVGKHLGSLKAK